MTPFENPFLKAHKAQDHYPNKILQTTNVILNERYIIPCRWSTYILGVLGLVKTAFFPNLN